MIDLSEPTIEEVEKFCETAKLQKCIELLTASYAFDTTHHIELGENIQRLAESQAAQITALATDIQKFDVQGGNEVADFCEIDNILAEINTLSTAFFLAIRNEIFKYYDERNLSLNTFSTARDKTNIAIMENLKKSAGETQ